jgi:hypothetical protein
MANPIKAIKAVKKVVVKKTSPAKKIKPKSNVKVVPSKTAPKTGLENRGAKLSKSQRSERAQDYRFDKQLSKYYSSQERLAGMHPSEYPKSWRGEGPRAKRKDAAIKKEGKPVIKINSNPKRGK